MSSIFESSKNATSELSDSCTIFKGRNCQKTQFGRDASAVLVTFIYILSATMGAPQNPSMRKLKKEEAETE